MSVLLPAVAAVIVKGDSCEADGFGGSPDADLDWSDFFFNLVSMVIVYVYFSKTTAAGESMVAIMLCMGVAGLDILLMALRWLWFDHYVAYGWVLVLLHTPAAAQAGLRVRWWLPAWHARLTAAAAAAGML